MSRELLVIRRVASWARSIQRAQIVECDACDERATVWLSSRWTKVFDRGTEPAKRTIGATVMPELGTMFLDIL